MPSAAGGRWTALRHHSYEYRKEVRASAEREATFENARDWARANDPDLYRAWENDFMAAGTVEDGDRVRDKLVETWRERTGASAQSEALRDGAVVDELTAVAVLAERLERGGEPVAAQQEAEVLYDSAERRQQLADRLEAAGIDPEATEARLAADRSQGVPARDAIAQGKKSPKARRARTGARQQEQTLGR